MKKTKNTLIILLAAILLIAIFSGCNKTTDSTASKAQDNAPFSYSSGLDANGYWDGIKALDYVNGFEYKGIQIPSDVQQVTDAAVQNEIDYMLSGLASTEEIVNRVVANGDTVNIDYVGSVDGVAFDGGSTGGAGTEVIAGSTNYIDDFLTQIIGHMPGETFNVEVTFPDDYHATDLQGKDAVFVTTINFIVGTATPELTDEIVATSLSDYYGCTTVTELKEMIKDDLKTAAMQEFIMSYIMSEADVSSIPDSMIEYQKKSMRYYYTNLAASYQVELQEFLTSYIGVESMDVMIANSQEEFVKRSKYSLVSQSIAEEAGLSATADEVYDSFIEYWDAADYSMYEDEYGLPYLKQIVIQEKVLDLIIENAVLS